MPITFLTAWLAAGWDRLRVTARAARHDETGGATLEFVIIALGLLTIATLLVVALTAAVRNRTDQLGG
jgi:Flp pilus assembly protein TadG